MRILIATVAIWLPDLLASRPADTSVSFGSPAKSPLSLSNSPLSRCYSSLNPTSPCYSGNRFPYYSAVPLEPLSTPEKKEQVDTRQPVSRTWNGA